MAFAFGMLMPVFNTLAVQRAPAHRRGAASATFYLFIDIGIGLGSAIWGLVIDYLGFDAMFTGAAICLVPGTGLQHDIFPQENQSARTSKQDHLIRRIDYGRN